MDALEPSIVDNFKTLPRDGRGGISYFPSGPGSTEATALWCLATFSHSISESSAGELHWILQRQNPNGSFCLYADFPLEGIWVTSQVVILLHHLGLKEPLSRALDFLRAFRSETLKFEEKSPVKLDDTIPGWPWHSGNFGWVEPTAWAVLALKSCGLGEDPRVTDGKRFLLDRAILDGGWNYGNREVYNRELIPFWDTTALALLALDVSPQNEMALRGLQILIRDLDSMESFYSLAWTVLALERWAYDSSRAKERLLQKFSVLAPEEKNSAHIALGFIALAPKRALTE